jgi:hypothetical protein
MNAKRTPRRHDAMWIALIIVAYVLLNWVVLPKLGVPT